MEGKVWSRGGKVKRIPHGVNLMRGHFLSGMIYLVISSPNSRNLSLSGLTSINDHHTSICVMIDLKLNRLGVKRKDILPLL